MGYNDLMIHNALDTMILSSSGWRKIFAPDGEHGTDSHLLESDSLLAFSMGFLWNRWLKARLGRSAAVLVGTDTRPTGPALARMIIAGLEYDGSLVHYAGIAAAPEIMARCGKDESLDAFAFISASHNPIGHNGVKFGLGGSVIGGSDAQDLIEIFRSFVGYMEADEKAESHLRRIVQKAVPQHPDAAQKTECLRVYKSFLEEIAAGPAPEGTSPDTLGILKKALRERPVRVVADLNGSARCVSVDRNYFRDLGVAFETFNDSAGDIRHQILPEGEALEPCRLALEKAHERDASAIIGYVPDNDGDRGNLVIWDETLPGARSLEAQEVFAMTVLAELAAVKWSRGGALTDSKRPAVVVNGPTSHRIRDIAALYETEVHEVEVGEANVVNRAAELRREGYQVRILGEGSNGGTITHPAAVRDPLNTISALLKLLRLPGYGAVLNPFDDWCLLNGIDREPGQEFGPGAILAALPKFTSTAASADRAVISIETQDQGLLKKYWEDIFEEEWRKKKNELEEEYGFTAWEERNNEGTVSRSGVGAAKRRGKQSGGLKVVFTNSSGQDAGFLWMRGSGTEAVFRVMAEIRGNRPDAERKLIAWHRGMVEMADRRVPGF